MKRKKHESLKLNSSTGQKSNTVFRKTHFPATKTLQFISIVKFIVSGKVFNQDTSTRGDKKHFLPFQDNHKIYIISFTF